MGVWLWYPWVAVVWAYRDEPGAVAGADDLVGPQPERQLLLLEQVLRSMGEGKRREGGSQGADGKVSVCGLSQGGEEAEMASLLVPSVVAEGCVVVVLSHLEVGDDLHDEHLLAHVVVALDDHGLQVPQVLLCTRHPRPRTDRRPRAASVRL